MPTLTLNQNIIANELRCPPGKSRVELCDTEVRGLYVDVRATRPGAGTYYLRHKDVAGKTCHAPIGRTDAVTLTAARQRAAQMKADIAAGTQPPRAAAAPKTLTLETFFTDHYLPHAKKHKRSWVRDDQLYRLRVGPKFGSLPLDRIERVAIQRFHTDLLGEKLSHASCDHHVKLMKHMFNLAIDWGHLKGENPATRVSLFNRDNKVEHYMDEAQLQRLLDVLRTDPSRPVCRIALFLLATGARLNEALSAKWSDIDRATRVWRITAETSKSKRVRSVPLNDAALAVLDELDAEGRFDNVFVNAQTGKPYTTIMKVWRRLRVKAGLPHLRIHDLRHQHASFLVNAGRTLYEVQQILGHSQPIVTQRYAHLSVKTLTEASSSAARAMGAAKPEEREVRAA